MAEALAEGELLTLRVVDVVAAESEAVYVDQDGVGSGSGQTGEVNRF